MCTLRVAGKAFVPDSFLNDSGLRPSKIYLRGEPHSAASADGPLHHHSGIHFTVSEAGWDGLAAQTEDALAFLTTHRGELERLRDHEGVESLALDFALNLRIDGRHFIVQSDVFPAALAKRAGELGLDLEFSIYPGADDER